MICNSCNRQRHVEDIKIQKSRLMPNMDMYLCSECVKNKFEPKWVIILAARTFGVDKVTDYIIHRRYVSDQDITGKEILVKK